MPATQTQTQLSPLAKTLLSSTPRRTRDAFFAGLLGEEVLRDAIAAAAYNLITSQDETVNLRTFLPKIETAVHEVANHLLAVNAVA